MDGNGPAGQVTCDDCGWPLDGGGLVEVSRHHTSEGVVRYRRCVCGAWLIDLLSAS
ncbi:hypothetical protein [Streptomyces boninensis]|uniref:hypothetical protein n=1 Tax=Streptomyces boninensis TaxID=2039455 RepID=UPI003B221BDA